MIVVCSQLLQLAYLLPSQDHSSLWNVTSIKRSSKAILASRMDVSIGALYRKSLSTRGKVLCDYLWCTPNSGSDLRSATKVLNFKPGSVAEVPLWTYDGAATGQESASCSVVYLKPRSLHPDPIRYRL